MSAALHYVVIGAGSAGHGAVTTLRSRDPAARITLVTMSRLPFYNRYDLPRYFRGTTDWRDLLAVKPQIYDELAVTLRRATRVDEIDGRARTITFSHKEVVGYDKLLVCTGGRGHLPEVLVEFAPAMHGFTTFEDATRVEQALPAGGRVVMLGGDMIGLDLARTLIDTGHKVTLVAGEFTFWPHRIDAEKRVELLAALGRCGVEVVDGRTPVAVETGSNPARRVVFDDGGAVEGDVVMPFFGSLPVVDFMLGAGVDMERGILVDPKLKSSNESIWAAGDVCQIWSDDLKEYRFLRGWRNVRLMGELAARNMTGSSEEFDVTADFAIDVDASGRVHSDFWEQ
jgi:NAD(P)H-nitrite reductase large subunit